MTDEQKVTRKLSAILSADVKGYSRLMSEDETHTIKTLKEYRSIITTIVNDHSGRVVDAPGDNLLAEFSSVVNAVQSSVDIQNALKENNTDLPDDKRLVFRIGVNIGDVVQDGDSLYGDGVNIAARIEGLADPGGVCISRNAYDHIHNKLNFGYEYLGGHSVKNIKNPVRVYKILMEPEDAGKLIGGEQKSLLKTLAWSTVIVASILLIAYLFVQKPAAPEFEPSSVEKMAFTLPEKPSIAVLAFDNMTGDSAQDYFCDGIAEEIITSISKINELFVVARNSSFFYKGTPVKIKQISEELGVRYVMEGSVRSSGDKVRITAQLIDAVKGRHIWAKNYDHNFGNILKIHDDISLNIAQNLMIKLTDGEQARIFIGEDKNPEVFYKHSEAMSHFYKYTKENIERFGQLAQEIVDMEPESPIGYRLLGFYHKEFVERGDSWKKNLKKAFEYAKKAFSLNENDPVTHSLMCSLYLIIREYEKSIASGKRAVELQPSGSTAHFQLGKALCYAEHYDEAITHCKQAIRLNPFPAHYYFYYLGLCYWANGQYEKALIEYKKAQQRAPDVDATYLMLAVIYTLLDREEEARTSAVKALDLDPKLSVSYIKNYWRFKTQDGLPVFIEAMRKAGFPE